MENLLEENQVNTQVLLAWKAPLRAYKRRGNNVIRFFFAVAFLLSIIVIFFGDRILLIPIGAVLFLFCVLTVTPPPEVENRVTLFGIETAGITLRWDVLSHFYFTKRFGFDVLTTVTHGPYYLHTYMVIPNQEVKNRVTTTLAQHIIYKDKPERTITDRLLDVFNALVPDDEDVATTKTEPEKKAEVKPEQSETSASDQTPSGPSLSHQSPAPTY